ncbi:hypothetical protein M406DRAFT_73012 [Cryphonectria parasitica EP155]|uniref:Uncharacterized protein n=1 Tax=Cryphonectria parasitica (strain ATCC 38755 / EP155) TaxID=660469 RepID=A0A9P4XSI8_CRYP1|nr:uncharacterized protein M406DRAFT_73012 [Cryphonectria parasitica EP155]KAF3760524.1 hypothetical protein M406DRAFT_73012 [Cryphonectria parasitica EP155]
MCGTHWIEYDCSHSQVTVRPGSQCAIGLTQGKDKPSTRLCCWDENPQGIEKVQGLCSACNFRKEKYGSANSGVQYSTGGLSKKLQLVNLAFLRSSLVYQVRLIWTGLRIRQAHLFCETVLVWGSLQRQAVKSIDLSEHGRAKYVDLTNLLERSSILKMY